jgi:hypothetical protein
MDKLVSRIPPPPRVPKVDGATPIAPTALDPRPDGPPDGEPSGRLSLPRWRARQIRRSREIVHASGAIVAAILLAALIAWSSLR